MLAVLCAYERLYVPSLRSLDLLSSPWFLFGGARGTTWPLSRAAVSRSGYLTHVGRKPLGGLGTRVAQVRPVWEGSTAGGEEEGASAADREIPHLTWRMPGRDGLAVAPARRAGEPERRGGGARTKHHANQPWHVVVVAAAAAAVSTDTDVAKAAGRGRGGQLEWHGCMHGAWREETPDEKEARRWLVAPAHRRASGPTSSRGEGRTRERGGSQNVGWGKRSPKSYNHTRTQPNGVLIVPSLGPARMTCYGLPRVSPLSIRLPIGFEAL